MHKKVKLKQVYPEWYDPNRPIEVKEQFLREMLPPPQKKHLVKIDGEWQVVEE